MKLNEGKCHVLVSGFKHEVLWANIGGKRIWESTENKLLGLHIDRDLQFTSYVSKLCTQAGQKLTAIIRIAKFMSLEKRKLVINSLFMSQFQYCPLTWMFHRALRLIYQEDTMTFKEFLEKDGAVTIHRRNIQNIGIEIFKAKNNLSPTMMKEIFPDRNYSGPHLGSQVDFEVPPVNSDNNGQETLRFLGPIIWEMIPNGIKHSVSLSIFKNKIKTWTPR